MRPCTASPRRRPSRTRPAIVVAAVLTPLLLTALPATAATLVVPAPDAAVRSVPTGVEPPEDEEPAPDLALCDHGHWSVDGYGTVERSTTPNGRTTKIGCTPAEPGFHVPTEGATSETACLPGTYQDARGQRRCKDAALGQFVDAPEATAPKLCDKGTYGIKEKATTRAEGCRAAEPGSFVASAGQAATTACSPGSYQPESGKDSCIPAAVGYYVPTSGAKAQTACPTATTTGSRTCVAAAPAPEPPEDESEDDAAVDGDFVRPDGEPCPAGTWSPNGLVPTASSCTPASPGTFVAEAGASEEVECPAGTYSGVFGATACTPADVGSYVPTAGSSSQLPCPSATDPGAATCDAALAAADTGSSGRLLPLMVAFVAVLVAVGAFVLLRQRGLLGARALPSRGDAWAGFDDVRDLDDRDPGPQWTQRLPDAEPRGPASPPEPPARPTRRFDDDLFDDDL